MGTSDIDGVLLYLDSAAQANPSTASPSRRDFCLDSQQIICSHRLCFYSALIEWRENAAILDGDRQTRIDVAASLLVCSRGARAITNSWYPGGIVPKLEKTKCGKENGCARPAERAEKVKLISNSGGGGEEMDRRPRCEFFRCRSIIANTSGSRRGTGRNIRTSSIGSVHPSDLSHNS